MTESTGDTRNVPGHRDAGPQAWHPIGNGCVECDAHTVFGRTLAQVERLASEGYIDDALYRAYMWGWTTWTPRLTDFGDWTPQDEETWLRVGYLEDAAGRSHHRFPIGPRRYGRETYGASSAACVVTVDYTRKINGALYGFAYRRVILAKGYLSIRVCKPETGEVVHEWGAPFQPQGPTVP